MSRIGRRSIQVPDGVKVNIKNKHVSVEGPKGKLELSVHPRIDVKMENGEIRVSRPTDIRTDRALHGLVRNLIKNMVVGVTEGYSKELAIEGVGFKAQMQGKTLNMSLGYTHDIQYTVPEGVEVSCPAPTRVLVKGCDKQKVGQVAANIRRFHEPEPYKGKGIHYVGEQIRRKQGKAVG